MEALDFAQAPVRAWFGAAFARGPTGAQTQAWPVIAGGDSTLLLAPTGSGKTLAAFLVALDRLMFEPEDGRAAGCRVLYVSPLKALGVDVERNLRAPLAGIRATAERLGHPVRVPSIGVRSGDTPQNERQRMVRRPPDILITTPESLYLMLTSSAQTILRSVDTVIVDEIHALVASKRGAHLFLSLERLEELRRQDGLPPTQRVGLSATQRPLDEIARLLGGGEIHQEAWRPRPVTVVDAGKKKRLDLTIEVPVEDMARLSDEAVPVEAPAPLEEPAPWEDSGEDPFAHAFDAPEGASPALAPWSDQLDPVPSGPAAQPETQRSIWPSIHPRLVELIRAHTSTLVFVNSRRLAERLAAAINEVAGEELCLAHHGSLSKSARAEVEDRLKRGQLPALVTTSSLELGIDMGAIDLVVQIEAPPSVASGMQRIGRANHDVGGVSKGIVFPKFRGDLLACAAVGARMLEGEVEQTRYPRNPLDVLAQQVVAIVSEGEGIGEQALFELVRRAAPFAELPEASFRGVLDMLSGRYPSEEFAELRPRLTWDRMEGRLLPRAGAKRIAVVNGGTIPDRGLYGVFLAQGGEGASKRVGELDEEMVFESRVGDVFLLGASSWRIEDITHDRVLVSPAPGEPGKMPFWHGDRPGRPADLGRAVGALTRALERMGDARATETLVKEHTLEPQAAENLVRYLREQRETSALPTDQQLVIERFTDEIGDWRVVVLTPFGARVHAPWATAVLARLQEATGVDVDMMWTDDGMVFRLLEADSPPDPELFLPRSDEVEAQVTRQLGNTSLFAAHFRENAGRALLLPKRAPGRRSPLWAQRRKAGNLLEVAARYPSFPIILETYRECLKDVFDLPALQALLKAIGTRALRVEVVDTKTPSPFAASVLFSYVANFIYEGDAPLAERRAQALSIDQSQLRALLGEAELRKLLDPDAIAEVERGLQRLDRKYPLRHADGIHDLLLQIGDLSLDELRDRAEPDLDVEAVVDELVRTRRAIRVRIAETDRIAAVEDAGRLRDGLGVVSPPGIPAAFLEPSDDPLGELVGRYARTHGPFSAQACAARLGLGVVQARSVLERLERRGRVQRGEFLPRGVGEEWCEQEVLRRLKRMSLARLRAEVEPVEAAALGRFLPEWHGLHRPRSGLDALLSVVEQLQGAPLVASELHEAILPARVEGYRPADLDELCAAGEVLWRGLESLGPKDGRVALYLTDTYPRLAPPPTPAQGALAQRVRALLSERGALFFSDLAAATGAFPADLAEALWDLVWSGEVSNDTARPLRSRLGDGAGRTRDRDRRRAGRSGRSFRSRRAGPPGTEGRWSLLPRAEARSETERRAGIAQQLLERHGVLTREAAAHEVDAGGFSVVYPVLKAMEEAGRIRRGYFVEGLGAVQFAWPGAEDRLRGLRDEDPGEPRSLRVLAATDPANPYGGALPWPEHPSGRPQRGAGARVVLHGGALIGFLHRSEATLLTYLPDEEPARSEAARALAEALAARVVQGARRSQLVARIDGADPREHPLRPFLEARGFAPTGRGLLLRTAGPASRSVARASTGRGAPRPRGGLEPATSSFEGAPEGSFD